MDLIEKIETINEKDFFEYMNEEDSSLYLAFPQSGDPAKDRRQWIL